MTPAATGRILIVDDEQSVCDVLAHVLRKEGYEVEATTSAQEALTLYEKRPSDLVIQDIRMPGMDGLALLKALKTLDPQALVAVLTAYKEDWGKTVECMRLGAYDYIHKPFDIDKNIRPVVKRAMQMRRFRRPQGGQDDVLSVVGCMKGNNPRMQEVYDLIQRVGPTDSTVLILGESGTGKELVARAIHHFSLRADKPFMTVNCGAFTESLLESELFGHVKGSFTGAVVDKSGLLEVAEKGTFFLDEISEMSVHLQVKLLRVLEEREFKPVGGIHTKRVDLRFVAATNRQIEQSVKNGSFREDLYYRLNVVPIVLPPLRERKDDVPLLAASFLARFAKSMKKSVQSITDAAMQALIDYDWPGNVRELENTIQRAVALTDKAKIDLADVQDRVKLRAAQGRTAAAFAGAPAPPASAIPAEGLDLEARVAEFEKAYLTEALAQTNGHLTKAAQTLRISLRSLRYKLNKYGMKY